MQTRLLDVVTGDREAVVDLTRQCQVFLRDVSAGDGLLHVFVPHATAGVAVIETSAGSEDDLLEVLREVLPASGPGGRGWQHRHGTPGHGRDHVLPALVPPFAVLPVVDGELVLGVWQRVTLVDTNVDNPRRSVRLSFLPSG